MKKRILIPGVLLGAIAALALIFSDELRLLKAVYDYKAMFEPEVIDESFRSMEVALPSIVVSRSDEVYDLRENFQADVLPEHFEYEGEVKNLQDSLRDTQATGIAVLHNGELVYESYARGNTRETRAIQMSVSKSMMSFMIGVAFEAGDIDSLEDPVIKYAPSLAGSAYDGTSIKNVLEMSSGVRWNEDYGSVFSDIARSTIASLAGSLDEFTASVPREFEPGTFNRYASIDTHALSMVLRGATGQSYAENFREKLWSRIGAEDDAGILVDGIEEPVAYGGVNIRLRDMVRFGELYLNGGVNYRGERLVSNDWIAASTQPDSPRLAPGIDNPDSDSGFGYKYQWWTPLFPDGDDYMALGIYGQFIYVNPARDVVIARTSAYKNYTVDGGYMLHESVTAFQAIARHLSPDEQILSER
ncbi:MAG: serine hydrolase [Pseudomonadota bacterium]